MTADVANPEPMTPYVGEAERPRRTFAQQALVDTFSRRGASIGLAWIGVIAFCAVFAPFLANSHPYLLKRDGNYEFPLFRHLTPPDLIALASALLIGIAALLRRRSAMVRLIVIAGGLAILSPLAMLKSTPEAVGYSVYREDEAAGLVSSVIRAPVPYSPSDRLRDISGRAESRPPSAQHWMGTTPNREDVFGRMIHACRIAILIGFISTGIAVVIGCIIGGLMGYFAGWVDIAGMRVIEIFEAIPTLFLLITFVAFYGRDLYMMMAIIGATTWPSDARFIRAQFLQLRKQDFVLAAIAAGLPLRSILFRHMLPNGIAPVLVTASFGVASAILAEATLSFLGLGLIDKASWGLMLNQARGVGTSFSWWLAVFPGGAIFLTVFAYNLIGEAFRDALDPKLRKRD